MQAVEGWHAGMAPLDPTSEEAVQLCLALNARKKTSASERRVEYPETTDHVAESNDALAAELRRSGKKCLPMTTSPLLQVRGPAVPALRLVVSLEA